MKILLMMMIMAFAGATAQARTYFVYGRGVALGPRFGSRGVEIAQDLAYSPLRPANTRAARALQRLNVNRAYLCQLEGRVRLVGVQAGTGAMLSEFRLTKITSCQASGVRAMVAAHRVYRR